MKTFATVFLLVFSAGVALVLGQGGADEKDAAAVEGLDNAVPRLDFERALPSSWKILDSHPAAKTRGWRQNGVISGQLETASGDVESLMAGCGYSRKHSVGRDEDGQLLLQFEHVDGTKVLWALRRIDQRRVGFSWGYSK